jgi:hypothetical protein
MVSNVEPGPATSVLSLIGGVFTGLTALLLSFFLTVISFKLLGLPDWLDTYYLACFSPVLLLTLCILSWLQWRKKHSSFMQGMTIGLAISVLLSSACGVLVANIKW